MLTEGLYIEYSAKRIYQLNREALITISNYKDPYFGREHIVACSAFINSRLNAISTNSLAEVK